MPYLSVRTNKSLAADACAALLTKASRAVAESLEKPEQYVMVALQGDTPMLFAGHDAPMAYLELKSIGLPESRTAALSRSLCDLMHTELGIPQDRVYIEFANAPRSMWGWNGATF